MKLEINNEKSWKIHIYVEIKQCVPKQPMDHRKNKKGNTLKQLKMETQPTKTHAAKAVLRGKFIRINMNIKKKKDHK